MRKGVFLALVAAALWGLTPVATKAALEGFTPEFIGFVRLAVATVLFWLAAGRRTPWFLADPWIWLAGAGLGADFLLYNYGVERTAANVAGLGFQNRFMFADCFSGFILGGRLRFPPVAGGGRTARG